MAETSRNKRSQSSESADLPKAKMLKTNSFSDLHNEMNAEKCTELKEKPEEQQHSNSAPTKMETTSSPLNTVEHENKSKNETEPCNSTANDASDLELCYKCHQSYKDKDPLLLGCLHTFCSRCILSNNYFRVISPPQNPAQAQEGTQNTHAAEVKSLIPEEAFNSLDDLLKYMEMNQTSLSKLIVTCPSCSCNSQARVVTRNGFIFNDKQESKTATRYCTNCEESAVAVRYCEDCSEDLCEQCVTAHKRVKLTKEHVLKSILSSDTNSGAEPFFKSQNYCQKHRSEQLKLFCESCNQLTCRDCQLEFHRDHKYQFVQEAANSLRKILQTMNQKLDEKNAYLKQTKLNVKSTLDKVNQRNDEVTQDVLNFHKQLQDLISNKSQFFLRKIEEITLQRRKKLSEQLLATHKLNKAVEHCITFIKHAMDDRNGIALLHSKQVVMEYLTAVMRQKFATNPASSNHLYFQSDPSILGTITSNMGSLFWGYPAVTVQKQVESKTHSTPQRPPLIHHRGSPAQNYPPANAHKKTSQAESSHQPQHSRGTTTLVDKLLAPNVPYYQKHQEYNMRHDAHEQNKLGHSHMAGPNRTVHPQRPPGMHSTPRVSHHPNTLPHHQNFQQNQQYIRPPRVNQIPGTQQLPRAGMSVNHAANGRVDNFNQRRSSGVNVTIKPKSPVATQPHQHMPQQFNQKNIKPFVSRASVQQSKPIERMKSNPMSFERSSSINSLHDQDFGSLHSPIKLNLTVTPPPQSSFLSEVASLVTHDALPMLQSPLLMESLSDRQHHSPEITPLPIKSPSLSSADSGFGTGVNRNPDQNNSAVKPDPGANLSPPPLLDFNEFIKQEAAEEDDTLKFLEDEKPDAVVEELVMTLAQEQKQDQKSPETPTDETTPPTNEASPDNETSPINENVNQPLNTDNTSAQESTFFSDWNNFTLDNMRKYDPNEDWCAVCNNGGDLLCCDSCPKVFHMLCHVPEIPAAPPGIWQCMLCRDLDTALEQEATTSKRKRYTGLQGKNLKLCERILLELFCFKQSTPFHFPVKTSVPNYYKIIKEPMDFLKIKKKLLHAHFSHYEDCEAFISDVLLVFTNCYLFNGEHTVLGTMGREVQQFFCERVHAWLPHMKDNLANLIEEQKQTLADSHVKPVLNTADQSKHVDKQKPLPYEHDDLWKPDIDEPDDDDDVIESATTSDGVSEEHSDTTDDSRRRKQSKSGIVHIQ